MTSSAWTPATKNRFQSRVKVLVADDDQMIANTLVTILNQAGFDALAVYSGKGALAAVAHFKPDVLLSDVMMPEMTGIEAAIELLAQCPTCKVVLFSGHSETADLLHGAHAQGHRFEVLAKPFHPEVLLRMLGDVAPCKETGSFSAKEAPLASPTAGHAESPEL